MQSRLTAAIDHRRNCIEHYQELQEVLDTCQLRYLAIRDYRSADWFVGPLRQPPSSWTEHRKKNLECIDLAARTNRAAADADDAFAEYLQACSACEAIRVEHLSELQAAESAQLSLITAIDSLAATTPHATVPMANPGGARASNKRKAPFSTQGSMEDDDDDVPSVQPRFDVDDLASLQHRVDNLCARINHSAGDIDETLQLLMGVVGLDSSCFDSLGYVSNLSPALAIVDKWCAVNEGRAYALLCDLDAAARQAEGILGDTSDTPQRLRDATAVLFESSAIAELARDDGTHVLPGVSASAHGELPYSSKSAVSEAAKRLPSPRTVQDNMGRGWCLHASLADQLHGTSKHVSVASLRQTVLDCVASDSSARYSIAGWGSLPNLIHDVWSQYSTRERGGHDTWLSYMSADGTLDQRLFGGAMGGYSFRGCRRLRTAMPHSRGHGSRRRQSNRHRHHPTRTGHGRAHRRLHRIR
jgi:hypothetical protein